MSTRHAILCLLAEAPMSGYDVAKRFEHSLQRVWFVRSNQIYVELKSLEEAKEIELTEYGPRNRKIYSITAKGLDEARQWLTASIDESGRSLRFEPLLRLNFLWMLDAQEAIQLLDAEALYYEEQVQILTEAMKTLPNDEGDASISHRRRAAIVGIELYRSMAKASEELRRTYQEG
ncbi:MULTISPECIES: PadR family transcriptional regulator [unclassified Roseitalea]|uniref:PadR family transcriptional regulator n=1 Tax=unclassified Roseitalea TaxID=2639107 RepID=UPI00273FF247|nr:MULTISPECIES: PadR family transcriptional regulator [unclassified Roseitalea]